MVATSTSLLTARLSTLTPPHPATTRQLPGLVWYAWFESVIMPELAAQDPSMTAALTGTASGAGPASAADKAAAAAAAAAAPAGGAAAVKAAAPPVPYRAFLRSKEMQALMVTHFCNNM